MAEKKEERRISPAIIVIPLGFGLVALGAIAMAALAKAAPGLANVSGKVTDANTGNPISGALIILDSSQVYTDAAGNFSFTGLSIGSHHIQAEKGGYQGVSEDITLVAGDNAVNIQMTPGVVLARLFGKVTDAETGQALAAVSVTLLTQDETQTVASAMTDANGYYQIQNITPGSYVIYFEKDGYETVVR